MTGAKKVVKIKNQFFHARQPRKGIFEIRSLLVLYFYDFWPELQMVDSNPVDEIFG